ncbi:MAG: TolC family protein, partial [Verrucomicrobiota bacterium]
ALKAREVEEDTLRRFETLLTTTEKDFNDGLLDRPDVLAVKASLATRRVTLIERKNRKKTTHDRLMQLMRVPIESWDAMELSYREVDEEDPASADLEVGAAFRNALVHRPDVAALHVAWQEASALVRAGQDALKPSLNLVGSLGIGNSAEAFGDSVGTDQTAWSVGLELELPWNRTAEKARLKQAEIRLRQIEQRQDELTSSIKLNCREAARDLMTARERLKAGRIARDLHAEKLEAERAIPPRANERKLPLLIEYQDDLSFADLAVVRATADVQVRRAQYLLVQGRLLTSNRKRAEPEKPELHPDR